MLATLTLGELHPPAGVAARRLRDIENPALPLPRVPVLARTAPGSFSARGGQEAGAESTPAAQIGEVSAPVAAEHPVTGSSTVTGLSA